MIEENKRVLLGMSGGTDSSVAAIRLLEAGYEVTGVTFRFYELNGSTEYLEDARNLAQRLGIRHLTYDAREIFSRQIIDYFVKEYLEGRTPVPCTLCNNYLKWPLLAKIADEMGIFYIATGHYVRKVKLDDTYYITSAADKDKDQSFFLWGLKQEILRRILLPMGDITKAEARVFAAERGFPKVAAKKDSLGVCFCPMDYRSFLKDWLVRNGQRQVRTGQHQVRNSQHQVRTGQHQVRVGQQLVRTGQTWSELVRRGKFVDEMGNFIAWHEGSPFYTIGQRRGLGIHLNRPVFVKDIFPEKNEIVLAGLSSLEKTSMLLKDWNLVDERRALNNPDIIIKIRYRKQENHGTVTITPDNLLQIQLSEPLTAVAPGQAAAFYGENLLLGGGIIVESR